MSNNSNRNNALSLLVNAADRSSETNRDGSPLPQSNQQQLQQSSASNGGGASSSYRGNAGPGGNNHGSLEEQLLLQQQQQQYGNLLSGSASGFRSSGADSYQMAQLLGAAGYGGSSTSEQQLRLAQQLQQQQQQRAAGSNSSHHHDMLAQLRAGALSGGASSWLGAGGGLGGGGFPYGGASSAYASELDRLEELARRQRLMQQAEAATYGSSLDATMAARLGLSGRGGDLLNNRFTSLELEQLQQQQQREQELANRGGAAANNSAQTPEANSGTAGSVIVPCRARGMPMDHNFKTAYFVIPDNVKHGEELICSYFACRNAGIKFRYCSHCKVPVAKRNFRKRHKHGGDLDVISQSNNAPTDGSSPTERAEIPSQINAVAKDEEDDDEDDAISSQSNTADSANLAARQATWMSLLSQRSTCMTLAQFHDWLERVLAVSSGGAGKTTATAVPITQDVAKAVWEACTQCKPVPEAPAGEAIPKDVVTVKDKKDDELGAKGNDESDDAEAGQIKNDDEEEGDDEDPQDYSDTEEELSTKRSPKNKFDEWKERKKQRKLEAQV